IHFTPNAAEIAAKIVEKVRINPGNYADKKKFETLDYTDESYNEELERIRKSFEPLVKICKEYDTAMRIGTNHGSLSDRILSRYGDTPLGMVESAMEFLRICRDLDYHNIVLSMKASNTLVVVQAYRLLVNKMMEEGMNYPLHLGVTEAGDGEDGRIKSAVGIGTLLEDGLGDTIRVSLTEEPEYEIPVAKTLVERYSNRTTETPITPIEKYAINPFEYNKRKTNEVLNIGGSNVPRIMADFSLKENIKPASFFALGYNYSVPLDKWNISDMACDYVFLGNKTIDFEVPGTLGLVYLHKTWITQKGKFNAFPFIDAKDYLNEVETHPKLNFVYITLDQLDIAFITKINKNKTAVLVIDTYHQHGMAEQRKLFNDLLLSNCETPVIIGRAYGNLSEEQIQLYAATDMGALLVDGLGDGIFIAAENCGSDSMLNQLAFGILQATRTRISKTEYISCPSCGRT